MTVDKRRELAAAKRWAHRVRSWMSENEKKRHWRHVRAHLLAALTGSPPVLFPEQKRLIDE